MANDSIIPKRKTYLEFREQQRKYRHNHRQTESGKAKHKAENRLYRARKNGVEGHHTAADIELQYKSQKGKCWHCGKKLNGEFHIDHLIPLARGGSNWPNNIVCACQHCNLSKSSKLPQEWNGKLF